MLDFSPQDGAIHVIDPSVRLKLILPVCPSILTWVFCLVLILMDSCVRPPTTITAAEPQGKCQEYVPYILPFDWVMQENSVGVVSKVSRIRA